MRCSKVERLDKLSRVNYAESRTVLSSTEGFRAVDTTKGFGANELAEFKKAIYKVSSRGVAEPVCHSSLSSPSASMLDPLRRYKGPRGNWSPHVIDPTILKSTNQFFKVNDLVEELGSNDSQRRLAAYPGAFLCHHRIPNEAIVERRNPQKSRGGEC
jgi:hypothetical protein